MRWRQTLQGAIVMLFVAGCEGGALPGVEPPTPDVPEPTAPPAPQQTSLWPLTTGSSWVYRITDSTRGVFEKTVRVEGTRTLPGGGGSAMAVLSTQPYLEELSWQTESDGLVYRVREEDRKDGALVRMTTWTPATLKSIANRRDVGWSNSVQVHEVVRNSDGSIDSEKDRVYVWRVLAIDDSVTTPAGIFQAVKIMRERPDKTGSERTYWLVPGIGKVREEGERLEELVRYDVRP